MVRVKICGNTTHEDAELSYKSGANMIGVIVRVSVSTPREVDIAQARNILEVVPDEVSTVVVTMPENPEEIEDLAGELDTDYFQIHSSLSESEMQEIKLMTGRKLIGVCSIPQSSHDSDKMISQAKKIAQASDILLLDTASGSGGGTGEAHNWEISRNINESLDIPMILAGGLTPQNVSTAIGEVEPWGVDVASGVEAEPGKKDSRLVEKFVHNAKGE